MSMNKVGVAAASAANTSEASLGAGESGECSPFVSLGGARKHGAWEGTLEEKAGTGEQAVHFADKERRESKSHNRGLGDLKRALRAREPALPVGRGAGSSHQGEKDANEESNVDKGMVEASGEANGVAPDDDATESVGNGSWCAADPAAPPRVLVVIHNELVVSDELSPE